MRSTGDPSSFWLAQAALRLLTWHTSISVFVLSLGPVALAKLFATMIGTDKHKLCNQTHTKTLAQNAAFQPVWLVNRFGGIVSFT